ncbi:hypothetical protein M3175_02225 [Robertmurraya korlensis]|uniref:hypothetical protein n=1 Tax=Robertmurraya korlensis TaxID=519977 RepID=UPI00203FF1CB|nr:hypothetical protein [Robertmurraya korlensis]MCM3599530.1 hypothetical protein [Robertmurraya korlensis]
MQFLLENPFILVVLIGIISSFYKQMKGQGEDDRQKRKQPKPFLPGQTKEKSKPFIDFDFGELQQKFERPQKEKKEPVVTQSLSTNRVQEVRNTYREQQSTPVMKVDRQTTGRLNQQPRAEVAVKSDHDLRVSSQTLRDAVIWSEILGPPKAKQGYHRKRTNSHY